MSGLRIFLFGSCRITHETWSSEVKVTPIIQSLLAYLLIERHRTHAREKLVGLFWGNNDEGRARSCLRTALYRLRRVLEPEGVVRRTYLQVTPTGEVGFNWESDHWLDVAVFEETLQSVITLPFHAVNDADVRRLESALELYTGDLLEGFYYDWILREREHLRRAYLNSLAYLMRYYKYHGDYEKSLELGHEILRRDPLREQIHRDIIRLYLESGRQALAVRQFEICREILATELGIQPMEETQSLFDQILSKAGHYSAESIRLTTPTAVQQAVRLISQATRDLDGTHEQLRQAIQLLERVKEC